MAKIPNIVKMSCTQDLIVQPICFTAVKVKASIYAISYLQMQLMLGLGLFSLLIEKLTHHYHILPIKSMCLVINPKV